jgi:hypothetical protein
VNQRFTKKTDSNVSIQFERLKPEIHQVGAENPQNPAHRRLKTLKPQKKLHTHRVQKRD